MSTFSSLVRKIATELRGDPSEDVLKLYEMPKISIEGRFNSGKLGYGVAAQDTFWVSQGVLNTKELRDSVDEQIIADLIISIVYRVPFAASKDSFDEMYNQESEKYSALNSAVTAYSESKLTSDIIAVFSVLKDIMRHAAGHELSTFKSIIYNGKASNSARSAFYAVFMALHDLIINESKAPSDMEKIVHALRGLHDIIKSDRKHVTTNSRKSNIRCTKGLIQDFFHVVSPSLANSGLGLITSFENDLRRSKMESARFELKQGILNLNQDFSINKDLLDKVVKIICGMANIGSESLGGNIYFGVSDSKTDSDRITSIFGIQPVDFADKDIFGIDHEAQKLGIEPEMYVKKIIQHVQKSKLSEPLKSSVLNSIEHFSYHGRTILKIGVPKQKTYSLVGDDIYMRIDSHTYPAKAVQIAEIVQRF
ncbi:ATP-binding protein [Vibrio owensii]|uniref:AlbA family DNA-binding domain-containing protein n=1 Tax=Vibrio owensii TaxID=696485 RepID=UPI000EFCC458|nr:ATP-binding protein [Vibrio owensii]AYO19897.1 ATP-binding protein [Vibrio owensii]